MLYAGLGFILVLGFGCGEDNKGTNPTPHNVVVTVDSTTFVQGVGLVNTFSATVTGATDSTVTWSVGNIAGGDSATVGSIAVTGRFRAPDSVPVPATVVVKARSVEDTTAFDSVLVTIVSGNGTGLPATYSTDPQPVEGPIFHGYWHDCSGTGNNLYQGECTPLAESPVNWAWGTGWTVTWSGQLFIPYEGNYTFNSHYWVDGIVYIEVNGTVVADFNTTGGGYSKTMTLPGNTWVPVHMSFEPNGGSNNMHLGWTSPGGEWCPIARSYLKP
jgi:hypothetical protein